MPCLGMMMPHLTLYACHAHVLSCLARRQSDAKLLEILIPLASRGFLVACLESDALMVSFLLLGPD